MKIIQYELIRKTHISHDTYLLNNDYCIYFKKSTGKEKKCTWYLNLIPNTFGSLLKYSRAEWLLQTTPTRSWTLLFIQIYAVPQTGLAYHLYLNKDRFDFYIKKNPLTGALDRNIYFFRKHIKLHYSYWVCWQQLFVYISCLKNIFCPLFCKCHII